MNEQQKGWYPNPGPQTEALRRTEFEILYGGARGGGKTEAGIAWLSEFIGHPEAPRLRALVLRKNATDLSDWIDRASRMFAGYGGAPKGNPVVFEFPSGYKIRTGHLKDVNAFERYQGHEYQKLLVEELTHIPSEGLYKKVLGSCRSTIEGVKPQAFLTTNPGSVGHGWVKSRFVDPAPAGTPFESNDIEGSYRIFIPSKIEDTPQLAKNDPQYIALIDGYKKTDVELWKAWRMGDWDVFAGQYFREFRRSLHVIPAFIPKRSFYRIAGMDWGRAAPFAFLTVAIQKVLVEGGISFNRAWVYGESYGTDRTPESWSRELGDLHDLAALDKVMADPKVFSKGDDGSISISDQFMDSPEFQKAHLRLEPANNDRINGWENLHKWLSIAPDGLPYMLFMDNCTNLIRTLPGLVHDETKIEDVDTDGEDHAPDALRYVMKHVRWIDASVGGIDADPTRPRPRLRSAAVNFSGEELMMDLDKFAEAAENPEHNSAYLTPRY